MHAGTRITGRLRQRFLRAALHQDVTHYDTQLTSADVVTGLSADCAAVQAAISEKVQIFDTHVHAASIRPSSRSYSSH